MLWSFEVKVRLNHANVRESFFQCVSNSSWAHYGYLAAAAIDTKIEQELNLLCNAHDIGIIHLNTDNPLESEIMLPCSEEKNIDWNTANRIAKENKDFLEYIRCIGEFYKIGRIKKEDWLVSG